MSAPIVYLVRHGEVDNPEGVLYGRLDGFGLTSRGARMAQAAADALAAADVHPVALYASPLLRARESAQPISDTFGLPIGTEPRLIETANVFEGRPLPEVHRAWRYPRNWRHLVRPWVPSWGEPYQQIADRMVAAMRDAARRSGGGDVVMVSHELPIWMVHRRLAEEPLRHNPALRRCALSSVTGFRYDPEADRFEEVSYLDPGRPLRG